MREELLEGKTPGTDSDSGLSDSEIFSEYVQQKATVVLQQNMELKRSIQNVETTNENLTYQINN